MFFKNETIVLASKFLWWGLIFGLVYIFCRLVFKLSRRNKYVCNAVSFVFWIFFGFVFSQLCIRFNNYSFCWYGLLSMFAGFFLDLISIDFVLTFFAKLLYSKVRKISKGKKNGKLRTSEKV